MSVGFLALSSDGNRVPPGASRVTAAREGRHTKQRECQLHLQKQLVSRSAPL